MNATRIGAGFFKSDWDETVKAIAAVAPLIAAAEREACAKMADREATDATDADDPEWRDCAEYIAAAIRARTSPEAALPRG